MLNAFLLSLMAREKMQTLYQEARVQPSRKETPLHKAQKPENQQLRLVWVGSHATHPIYFSE
jgi:hypothetical protein